MTPYQPSNINQSNLSKPTLFQKAGHPTFEIIVDIFEATKSRLFLLNSERAPTQSMFKYWENIDWLDRSMSNEGRAKLSELSVSGTPKLEEHARLHFEEYIEGKITDFVPPRPKTFPQAGELPYGFTVSSAEIERALKANIENFLPGCLNEFYSISSNGEFILSKIPQTEDEIREIELSLIGLAIKQIAVSTHETLEFLPNGVFLRCKLAFLDYNQHNIELTVSKLSSLQQLISSGQVSGATVECIGAFDAELLDRISSQNVGHLGVCPDVELVYSLPLPCGETYHVAMKEARYFSNKQRNNHERYNDEERQIIDGVKEYLAASTRLNPWLFGKEPTREVKESVSKIPDLSEFGEEFTLSAENKIQILLKETWARFQKIGRESMRTFHREREETISFPEFKEKMLHVLNNLDGFTKNLRGDDFFVVAENERMDFVEHYAPQLYKVYEHEQQRQLEEETDPEIHQHRLNLGYVGPSNGYELKFEYRVMDMIYDYRKKIAYKERKSLEHGKPVEAIEVPPHIGRSFERTANYADIFGVSAILDKSKASRIIEVERFDPVGSKLKVATYSEKELKALLVEIVDQNLTRLVEHFDEPAVSNDMELSLLSNHTAVYDITQGRIQRLQAEFSEMGKEHKEFLRKIGTEIGKTFEKRDILIAEKEEREAEFKEMENIIHDACNEMKQNLFNYLKNVVPHLVEQHCETVRSIHDYYITKLIYCVNPNAHIAVQEEQPGTLKRSSHSELLGGGNGYGMGEYVFGKFDELFLKPSDWLEHCEKIKNNFPTQWKLYEINNQSGHYLPEPVTLKYVSELSLPAISLQGISTNTTRLVDRLKPGLKIQNTINYWGRKNPTSSKGT